MVDVLKCRPGDLAVVVSAVNEENLGKIVQVISSHDGQPFNLREEGASWRVRCAQPIAYVYPSGRRVLLEEGPIRDVDLHPIRGSSRDARGDGCQRVDRRAPEEQSTVP